MSKGKGLLLLEIKQVERIKKSLQHYIGKNKFSKRWDDDSDSYMPLSPTLSKKTSHKKSIINSPREQVKKKERRSKTPQFTDSIVLRSRSKEIIEKKISRKEPMPRGFGVTQGGKIIRKDLSDEQESILFSQILSKKNGQLEQVLNNMTKNRKKKIKSPRNEVQDIQKQEYFQMKVVVSDENKLEKQKTVYSRPYTFSSITDLLDKRLQEKQEKQEMIQNKEKEKQKQKQIQSSSLFSSILKKFGGNLKKVQQKKEEVKNQKDQNKIQEQKNKKMNGQKQKQNIPELIKAEVVKSPEEQKIHNDKFSTIDKSIKQQNYNFNSLKTEDNNLSYYESAMTDRQKSRKSMKVYPAINFTERQENQLRSKYWNLNSKLDQLKNRIRKQCYDKQKDKYEKSIKQKSDRSREIQAAGLYKKLSPIKKIQTELERRNLELEREKYQKSLTKQLKLEDILRTQDLSQSVSRKKRNPALYYSHRSKQKQKLVAKKK